MELKQQKRALRKEIKGVVAGLSDQERMQQANIVLQKLESLALFEKAKVVMLFWSFGNEISTHDFGERVAKTKEVLLPVIDGDELLIKVFTGKANMIPEPVFGIQEPQGPPIANPNPDLIFLPGIAFDSKCNRLGRGKAYYDKLLNRKNLQSRVIGIGYKEQLIDQVPVDSNDYPLDMVVTPVNTFYRKD